jgi:hypothetical protein
MVASLAVPIWGRRSERAAQAEDLSAVDLIVRPKRVRIESNDHNRADALTLVADWTESGVDPRLLGDGVVTLYLGNADDSGFWVPGVSDLRFIGLVKDVEARREAGDAPEVTIEALDYTTLFLEARPFGSSGIPDFSQTLDEAWRRVVSQTPGAEVLADRLVRDGVAGWPVIGEAAAERFRKLKARVPVNAQADAWAVWQQTVGMLGLISYIRADECVVTTARNLYTEADPPVLIWGKNISSWSESRHAGLARKGVAVASWDPERNVSLEAFYPPIGDERVKRKRAGARKKTSGAAMLRGEDREFFTYHGVTSQDALDQIAERIWEERSRQELSGRISTAEMECETVSGSAFDLLSLRAGDSIQVQIDAKDRQLLSALPTDGARVRYLQQRGYSAEVAQLIVANMAEYSKLESKFFVQSVVTDLQLSPEGGSFEVTIDYVNRIQIDGSATEDQK